MNINHKLQNCILDVKGKMEIILLFTLVCSWISINAQNIPKEIPIEIEEEEQDNFEDDWVDPIEESPFPKISSCENEPNPKDCSYEKFIKYINSNLKIKKIQKEGFVVISYKVDTLGNVYDEQTERGLHKLQDKKALKVFKRAKEHFGSWNPGKVGGRKVTVKMRFPIRFEQEQ